MADAASNELSEYLERTLANIPLPGSDSTVIKEARRIEREAKAAPAKALDIRDIESYVKKVECEVAELTKGGKAPEPRITMHIESLLTRTSLLKVLQVVARGWLREAEAFARRMLETPAGQRVVQHVEWAIAHIQSRPRVAVSSAIALTFALALAIGVSAGAEPAPAQEAPAEPVLHAAVFPVLLDVPDAIALDPQVDYGKAKADKGRRGKRRR